jgi:hypothetical protein
VRALWILIALIMSTSARAAPAEVNAPLRVSVRVFRLGASSLQALAAASPASRASVLARRRPIAGLEAMVNRSEPSAVRVPGRGREQPAAATILACPNTDGTVTLLICSGTQCGGLASGCCLPSIITRRVTPGETVTFVPHFPGTALLITIHDLRNTPTRLGK